MSFDVLLAAVHGLTIYARARRMDTGYNHIDDHGRPMIRDVKYPGCEAVYLELGARMLVIKLFKI